mmetsp:Transcript_48441/g.134751  ORF Transcript_48441/g.134751 Transcript_48441/m.134751 type:complete len:211 (-) Transcript_48441:269-901(-)
MHAARSLLSLGGRDGAGASRLAPRRVPGRHPRRPCPHKERGCFPRREAPFDFRPLLGPRGLERRDGGRGLHPPPGSGAGALRRDFPRRPAGGDRVSPRQPGPHLGRPQLQPLAHPRVRRRGQSPRLGRPRARCVAGDVAQQRLGRGLERELGHPPEDLAAHGARPHPDVHRLRHLRARRRARRRQLVRGHHLERDLGPTHAAAEAPRLPR